MTVLDQSKVLHVVSQVRRSIEDLLHLVQTYPRENTEVSLGEQELLMFTRHYSKIMYQSILSSTQSSLQVRAIPGK